MLHRSQVQLAEGFLSAGFAAGREQVEHPEPCIYSHCFTHRASPASARRSPRSSRGGRRWSAGHRRRWWRSGRTSASAAGMEGSWSLARSQAALRCTTQTASTWPRDLQVSALHRWALLGSQCWLWVSWVLLMTLHSIHSILTFREIILTWTDLVAQTTQPWFAPHCDCKKVN